MTTERSDVVVLGGGVVGVCTAHFLSERGADVRIVERGEICSGCSHGNAGWIFPSHSIPLPAPGVIQQALRWLFDPESSFYIRPRLSLELVRWLWRFRRACNEQAMRRTFELNRALSLASLERYGALAKRPGLEFGFGQRGLLVACRSAEALREIEEELELLRSFGGEGEVLQAEALRERVPPLSKEIVGGAYLPADGHLIPGDFVRGLARDLESRGVPIDTESELLAMRWGGRGPLRLRTTRGELRCEELVLAAGAWSPEIARPLGLRLPVEGAKGYSVTVRRPEGFGETPLMLTEARIGVTPLGANLRFAGTLELAGMDLRVNLRRVRAIERAAREFLPDLPETDHVETWRGLRPLTPDDLPIIGRPRGTSGLVVATGHGMSGISQGAITGELVAQLLCGETPSFDLAPFSPDRF